MILPTPKDFDEICEQAIKLGDAAGMKKEAEAEVEAEKRKVREITELNRGRKRGKGFIQVGTKPIFGVTPDYYAHTLLSAVGLDDGRPRT